MSAKGDHEMISQYRQADNEAFGTSLGSQPSGGPNIESVNLVQTNLSEDFSSKEAIEMKDMNVRFSTLWIFAMFNYLYADIHSLIDPTTLKEIMTGYIGPLPITQGFLLGSAILIETAIAMVLLSRLLEYTANRWANIVTGILHTAAVVSSLFLGGTTPTLYYMFFAAIEIVCTSLIVWYAWRWKPAIVRAIA